MKRIATNWTHTVRGLSAMSGRVKADSINTATSSAPRINGIDCSRWALRKLASSAGGSNRGSNRPSTRAVTSGLVNEPVFFEPASIR